VSPGDLGAIGLVVASLAMVCGAAVQGAVGIGFALVAVPVLVLVDPGLVPGPFLVGGTALSLLVARRDHEHAQWDEVGWASVGRFPGAVVGAGVIALVAESTRGAVVGLAVLGAVAISLSGVTVPLRRSTFLGAGAMSGVMGTVAGLDGPPMALLYQHHPGHHVRANMARFFLIGSAQSAVTLAVVGAFGVDEALTGLLLVPGTLLGYLLSGRLIPVLDQGWTRSAILAVAAAGGLAVLLRSVL
jgi:uncharacterized membrane protein YfcA